MEINIGKRKVGDGHPCFVIAEAGANFRISDDPKENYSQAIKLIDIAVDAGADAVKFQLYRAKKMYVKDAGHADYIGKQKKIYDIIKEMELPYEWLPKLNDYCEEKDIMFCATPFDKGSADELEKIGMQFYKIASYSLTDQPLLKHIAAKGKPIIISTGASNLSEVQETVKYLKGLGNDQIIVLQCTAKYPAPLETVNLKALPTIREATGTLVGLSDHSREPVVAPMGSVALGGCVVEKHYTTDNSLPGPDHGFAILPEELRSLVQGVHDMESALGEEKKESGKAEEELRSFARHFIYTTKPIKKGEPFTEENVSCLRPGKKEHGLEPKHYESLLGQKASEDVEENTPVKWDLVQGGRP